MELHRHDHVESFLAAATPLLLRDEARHNLLFGICSTLTESPSTYPEFHLWTVASGEAVVGAALCTPPHNAILARPDDAGVLEFLAAALDDAGASLPGVTGARPEADEFAAAWESRTGCRVRPRMGSGIYRVAAPVSPDGVEGRMRPARSSERGLLIAWMRAFAAEARPEGAPIGNVEEMVDRRLDGAGAGLAVWEHGEPVCCSGFGGRTPNGMRIGPVYTPPEHRRRGYASALVARLSRQLIDEGSVYCFLYTDLANPTSNRIYMAIGYELVAESVDYAFEPAS